MSQTTDTLTQSFLSHVRKLVKAGGEIVHVNVTGEFLICTDVLGSDGMPFELAINDGRYVPFNLGLEYRTKAGDRFAKISLRNPTEKDITVEFYAGAGEFGDARLNIVRGRQAPVMHAETVITGHSATIPANDEIDLTAPHPTNPRFIRKATIVTNMDPAVELELLNEDDQVLASVFYRTAFLMESSAPIKVKNNSAAPVVCRIAQLWYVIQ